MHFGGILARFILLFSLLYAAFGVLSPFFPSFLAARGLDPAAIAVVLAAGTAIRLLTVPLAGRISDRLQATRAVLAVCIAVSSATALSYLSGWGFWPLLLLSLAAAVFLGPVASLADVLALGAAAQSREPGKNSFDYGWVRGAGSAAFIVGSLIAGQAIGYFGLSITLVLQAGLLALAAISAAVVPQQPLPTAGATPQPDGQTSLQALRKILAIPHYGRIALVATLVFGSHAVHDSFAVIRWRDAGLGPELISLLWSESVASEVIIFLLIGPKLLQRFGPRLVSALCAALGVLRWIVMAQTAWVPALVLVQPLHGFTFALLHLACMYVLSQIVPSGLAATGLTFFSTITAVASVLLTLVAGLLYGQLGPASFWAMAGLCAIAVPVALTLKLHKP